MKKEQDVILVSACLAGEHCRWDGQSKTIPMVKKLVQEGKAVAVCPEKLGGLPVPRPPAEISGGDGKNVWDGKAKVFDKTGYDVTPRFIEGAQETLKIALELGAKQALLKTRSPSCGHGLIYDGTFQHRTRQGSGVTAVLLARNQIEIMTEEDFDLHFKK